MTKLINLRNIEKRESRIKVSKSLILSQTSESLMNNQKWFRVFEWLETSGANFELKTLLSESKRKVNQIYELENTSILIDNSGDFIEFLEIEKLYIDLKKELKSFLDNQNIKFHEVSNQIIIFGYL